MATDTNAIERRSPRYAGLDGLRGLAALVVVFHHVLLTNQDFFGAYVAPTWDGGVASYLTYSPLHLFWVGREAVFVFFVLSGLVLVLPFLTSKLTTVSLARFYPQRVIRIYLPVWAATLFGWLCFALVDRYKEGVGVWLGLHDFPVTPSLLANDLFLLSDTNFINSPLWSLRWEVLFSLLLPGFVYFTKHGRRFWPMKLLVILALISAGNATGHQSLQFLPIFGLGALIAVERERLCAELSKAPRTFWWLMIPVALLLLNVSWTNPAMAAQSGGVATLTKPLACLGAAGVVILFLPGLPGSKLGMVRSVQWLGKRSFSLYLVHEPIVVTLAYAFGGTPNLFLLVAAALPASLLASHVFFLCIERPSLHFARRVGRKVSNLLRRRSEPIAAAP